MRALPPPHTHFKKNEIDLSNSTANIMIVVELKAIKDIEDVHFAIVRSYLKSVEKKHGLLLNFAKVKLEVKRVIYDE